VVRRLVGNADVFIENFLPGTQDKAGLGWGLALGAQPGAGVRVDHGVRRDRPV